MSRAPLGGPLDQAAGEAVRNYLDALQTARRPPGPHLTQAAIGRRLARIDSELAAGPPPMVQLRLVQERHDLHARAAWQQREDAFVQVASGYGRRHGITYDTWLEVGVPDSVLRRARIRPDLARTMPPP